MPYKITDRTLPLSGALASLLLASTMLATPAFAQAQPDAAVPSGGPGPASASGQAVAQTQAPLQAKPDSAPEPVVQEVIVTAEKRSESIQKVPASIQALDTRKLAQLEVFEFQDYIKYLPSVTYQTLGPNQTSIYMRGVASGDNANHSGPLPSVGAYLDEAPITTIGGTLDVHVYDIARIEALPGPQGTLYGASSEAGTLRIITNQPSTKAFSAAYDVSGNQVDHGGAGYEAEGYVNIPLTSNAAIRLVGWDEHDAGYIDNVLGTRPFATSGTTIDNAAEVKNNFNHADTYGGRAALKIDLDQNWTITPSIIAQDQRNTGVFGYEPSVGDLKVNRFQPDTDHDRWAQAALTINGKLGKYDLVYSGSYFQRRVDQRSDYTDYSVFYDQAYGSGANWQDSNGNILPKPEQEIIGIDRFTKESNELRIVAPATDQFRFIAGLFQERQTHWIIQDYEIQGFGSQLAVPGYPNTIWLTNQMRIDRDQAAFGEITYDLTDHLSLTAGVRLYKYQNSLSGFYGFSEGYDELTGFSSGEGADDSNCLGFDGYHNTPCTNLNKTVKGQGETHRFNLNYKFDSQRLVYFTYSTGYRPGGVNRNGSLPPYSADHLTNYEIGWKTSWFNRRLTFNGALYDEDWSKFQFSYLGANSLTVIENAPSANIKGVESNIDWLATRNLDITAGFAYTDAKISQNFCGTDQATGLLIANCTATEANANQGAAKGTPLPYTPSVKANLTARYTFRIADWDAHIQGGVVGQDRNHVALRSSDAAALGSMPGYATADFTAGVERHGLTIEAYLKNAFDERGEVNRYTPCTVSVCAAQISGIPSAVYVIPVQPLTFGLKFGQAF